MVIFTTLHGPSLEQPVLGYLNPVGGYPRYWSIFSRIQSYVVMYVCITDSTCNCVMCNSCTHVMYVSEYGTGIM